MRTLQIVDDFGEVENLAHGMITASEAREWWSIHPDDPLSARARTRWIDEMRRVDWALRTEAESEMWADATHFHLTARVRAFENDRCVFEKDYEASLARDLV